MEYTFLLIMILFTVTGQLLIKKASSEVEINIKSLKLKNLINFWFLSGVLVTFCAPIFYFLALKKIDLSTAFAFSSLNYVLIMAASAIFFKEKISVNKIIGTLIIVIGVLLFSI